MNIFGIRPDEIIVDCFAGGGGASLGIEMALGRGPNIAINHDREAIAMHTANHRRARHFCEDVWDVDPRDAAAGRPVGLAWFSPDCTYHSKARGGKPFRHRNRARRRRGLAWIVIKWAKLVRPRIIMMENVEEFQDWGPLLDDGTPCPIRKGLTFRRWKKQLENVGYVVEGRELRACDYGAPTIRRRLFVIARRDGLPIVWPAPTHGAGLLPYRTAAECIDWSLPCPSIFERKRPLAEATMRRIAKGVKRYVLDAADPFIVPITHTGGDRVHSIREPVRTVTTARRGELALAVPTLIQTGYGERPGQEPRVPGLDKPLGTVVAGGTKHALVAAFLAQHNTGMVGHHASKPLSTITARGTQLHTVTTKDRFGIVTVKGEDYVIADIGMRMLQPRELYRAQGFPDSYVIDPQMDGKSLTKTAQVRMCGNSVSPVVTKAIVEANLRAVEEGEAAA